MDSTVSSLRLRWVKGVCVAWFGATCTLAEWPGFLKRHGGNAGMERTLNRVGTESCVSPQKKILPPILLFK